MGLCVTEFKDIGDGAKEVGMKHNRQQLLQFLEKNRENQ